MTARKATKNLDWNEWLTVHFGQPRRAGRRRDADDIIFSGPRGCDRSLLYLRFSTKGYDERGRVTVPSFVEELEARGYDTTTLEFRVKRKVQP